MNKSDLQKLFSQTQNEFEQNWDGKKKLFEKLALVDDNDLLGRWSVFKKWGYAVALAMLLLIFSVRYLPRNSSVTVLTSDYYTFEDFEGIYEVAYTDQTELDNEEDEYYESEEAFDEILL